MELSFPSPKPASSSPAPNTSKYDPNKAVRYAQGFVSKQAYNNYCWKLYEDAYGVKVKGVDSARASYLRSVRNRTLQQGATPPAGAAVYFRGNPKYGHVAISAGGGYVISSGIHGRTQKIKITDLPKYYGAKEGAYLGFSSPDAALAKGSAIKVPSPPRAGNVRSVSPVSPRVRAVARGTAEPGVSGVPSIPSAAAAPSMSSSQQFKQTPGSYIPQVF